MGTENRSDKVILVAEDDDLTREMVGELLGCGGFKSTLCADGEEAAEELRTGRYAVVLTDLHMPRRDGLGLIEEVQRFHPGMPVVVMSGYFPPEVASKLNGYPRIQKPLNFSGLIDTVTQAATLGRSGI